jgi:hypothetical protein
MMLGPASGKTSSGTIIQRRLLALVATIVLAVAVPARPFDGENKNPDCGRPSRRVRGPLSPPAGC